MYRIDKIQGTMITTERYDNQWNAIAAYEKAIDHATNMGYTQFDCNLWFGGAANVGGKNVSSFHHPGINRAYVINLINEGEK